MLDRRAMFAHGMPMVTPASPEEVSHACHHDAATHRTHQGNIPCPACGDRLHYRLRHESPHAESAIFAHCTRTGCIAILA